MLDSSQLFNIIITLIVTTGIIIALWLYFSRLHRMFDGLQQKITALTDVLAESTATMNQLGRQYAEKPMLDEEELQRLHRIVYDAVIKAQNARTTGPYQPPTLPGSQDPTVMGTTPVVDPPSPPTPSHDPYDGIPPL